jgi:hypothetical protein
MQGGKKEWQDGSGANIMKRLQARCAVTLVSHKELDISKDRQTIVQSDNSHETSKQAKNELGSHELGTAGTPHWVTITFNFAAKCALSFQQVLHFLITVRNFSEDFASSDNKRPCLEL